MKNNSGITLLELLIAMSMLTLVIFAAGSFFLSSMNISADTQDYARAQRSAQLALMHIKKYAPNAASEFKIENNGGTLRFMVYDDPPDLDSTPAITYQYEFIDNEIRFYPDYEADQNNYIIVSQQIAACEFSKSLNDGVVLHVEVTATDDDGENNCSVSTSVEACLTASPAVYTVP